ncbi:hypothetical protein K9U40_13095 [Xanthobacter autotrophicus]|uniref:hypothetical protein n=1 Tax=Xanthobacter TaxID=279 RepID=UPI0024AC805A|nr:hypothetical protein [Xanthobacter autotrophicus]MDI4665259.1 hypothetical protein [Xanthobacter autotrophicus]
MLSLSLSLAALRRRAGLPMRRVVGGIAYGRLKGSNGALLSSADGRALYGRIA